MLDATERGNCHSAFFQDHISRYFPGKADPEIERENCKGAGRAHRWSDMALGLSCITVPIKKGPDGD